MRNILASGFLMVLFLVFNVPNSSGGQTMQLSSSAFSDGGKIPQQYVMAGAGGKNLSLPLAWSGAPAGTKSFALSIVDPHPVAHNWVHWLVVDIPANVTSFAEGASGKMMPPGTVELNNSWGEAGYGGPQPPRGTGDHPYVVTLFALNVPKLEVKSAAGLAGFQQALEGKILATATVTGYYGR